MVAMQFSIRNTFSNPVVSAFSGRTGPAGWTAGLVAATAVWGWAFIAVRGAVAHYPVDGFLFLRFLIGGAALGALALRSGRGARGPHGARIPSGSGRPAVRSSSWRGVGRTAGLGALLLLGYLAQTEGLRLGVSPGTAAMLTGLVVVFTPGWEWALERRAPSRSTWATVVAVLLGTALVSAPAGGAPAGSGAPIGVGREAVGSLVFSLQLVLQGRAARHHDPLRLAAGQLLVMPLLLLPALLATGGLPGIPAAVVPSLVAIALLASAAAFGIQTAAQRRLAPTVTALILSLEPAFGLGFAAALTREAVSPLQLLGATVIVGALVVAAASALPRRGPLARLPGAAVRRLIGSGALG